MDLATPEMLISRKWNYCFRALATTHTPLEDPPLMIDETTLQSSACKEKPYEEKPNIEKLEGRERQEFNIFHILQPLNWQLCDACTTVMYVPVPKSAKLYHSN
jgi:hypothetical protein